MVSVFTSAQNAPEGTATPAASSVIQQDIFVRGGPGRDYLPVGKLLAGDRVRPLSRSAQSDWVLIVYGKGYGWIRRDLAFWVEDIDALPVIDTANLTPSPVIPTTPASTPILAATETPSGNWVQLNDEAQSGYVRAGPGRTYLRLGQLYTGDAVEPVSQNADGTWIMIRFGEGFGWIARNLVRWVDDITQLPVISSDNLTPTATFTATATPTQTWTPSATFTLTSTQTPTFTLTITASASATSTFTPTATATSVPSETPTATPVPSETPQPTATLTETPVPSETPKPTATLTETPVPSETPQPTATLTETPLPSETPQPSETPVPTATLTPSVTLTASATLTLSPTVTASATLTLSPTVTASATLTQTSAPSATAAAVLVLPSLTATLIPTDLPTATPTQTAIRPTGTASATLTAATQTPAASATGQASGPLATVQASATRPQQTATSTPPLQAVTAGGSDSRSGLPTEAVIAGLAVALIVLYGFFYWRGAATTERYANGFVVDTCPVCGTGHLIVESRQERLMGVPRARHSVRCSECRSVLREVREGEWRYAVDPVANPALYQAYNGKLISDDQLTALAASQTRTRSEP